MEITTNNNPRKLISYADLPDSVKDDFDYLDPMLRWDYRFFCYRGYWYDSGDMLNAPSDSFPGWHAYMNDSFYSGVVIRFVDGFDSVIVGQFVA